MAIGSRLTIAGSLLIALAFVGHLINVLVLEPGLGFSSAEDYYYIDRLLAVADHPVWKLGALYHLLIGVAAAIFALAPLAYNKGGTVVFFVAAAGICAAASFTIVAMTNIAGLRELTAIAQFGVGDMPSVNAAFALGRTVLLYSAVFFLGVVMLIGNAGRVILAADRAVVRYLGIFAGLVSVLLPVLPFIAPIVMLSMIGWGGLTASLIVGNRSR